MKSRTSATLVLLAVFLLGSVAGAVSFHLYQRTAGEVAPRNIRQPYNIAEEFAQGLNLDAEQQESIKKIITRSREQYRTLAQQFRPQYEIIRNDTQQQIMQILREDQRARFEESFKNMRGLSGKRYRGRDLKKSQ